MENETHKQRVANPSPEEIDRACIEIRRQWSVDEYYRRAGLRCPGWMPPVVETRTIVTADDHE